MHDVCPQVHSIFRYWLFLLYWAEVVLNTLIVNLLALRLAGRLG